MLYRDAGVESTEDAAHLPRYYSPPRPNQKKAAREDNGKQEPGHSGFFVRAACMCMACALLGGIVGVAFSYLLSFILRLRRNRGDQRTGIQSGRRPHPHAQPVRRQCLPGAECPVRYGHDSGGYL